MMLQDKVNKTFEEVKENGLLKSEIRKAEKYLSKKLGKQVVMTGYFAEFNPTEALENWHVTFECEMCSDYCGEREQDVLVHVFLADRKRTWVSEPIK